MLVVDDDDEVRAVVSEYIGLQGFHVLEAKDGLEALLQVKHERPQAIILVEGTFQLRVLSRRAFKGLPTRNYLTLLCH